MDSGLAPIGAPRNDSGEIGHTRAERALSRRGHHGHHFVGAFYLGKNTLHGLEFGLMSVAVHFGNGIFDYDHAVIVLDPTADCGRDADTGGDARHHAGVYIHIAQNGVERRVREATETLLDDEMLAFPGLQLIDDLRTPGAFGNEGTV